jgi:sugar lactone lactonase YvrE
VFSIDDTPGHQQDVGYLAVSNTAGEAQLSVWLPGCPRIAFELYAQPPAGYLPTTPQRLRAGYPESGGTFQFGYALAPGMPTPMPQPPASMSCTSYDVMGRSNSFSTGNVTGIAAAADGTVWVATNEDLVARFAPATQERTAFSTLDGIPDPIVRAIAVTPNGRVWVGTNRGLASFRRGSWHSYASGAVADRDQRLVNDVALAPGGRVWLTSGSGDISLYQPDAGIWQTDIVSRTLLTSDYRIDGVEAPTGSTIWFFSYDTIYQMIRGRGGQFDWIAYRQGTGDWPGDLISINGQASLAASADLLWLAGSTADGSSIVRWDVAAGQWTTYNHRTTGGAMYGSVVSSLALAPDGSVWAGLYDTGAVHFLPGAGEGQAGGQWLHYDTRNGLPSDQVLQVAVAPDGAVWFGGDTGYVARCVENR